MFVVHEINYQVTIVMPPDQNQKLEINLVGQSNEGEAKQETNLIVSGIDKLYESPCQTKIQNV